MKKLHTFLVTAYLLGGLCVMASTPWMSLQGMLLNSGGATLAVEGLHAEALRGSAEEAAALAEDVVTAAQRASASRQLMFGILLFTLGGFMHAYEQVRSERPVKITVKKRKPMTLFWLEMKV